MFYVRYILLLFVVSLLESTVGHRLAIGGIRPDFGLALVVYAGLAGGGRGGTFVGFLLGMVRGCTEPSWLGLETLLLSAVGFAAACTSPMVNREHPLVQGGLIAAMILVHDLIRFLVLSGASLSRALPLWVSISPGSAAYSGLLIPLAVAILPQILVRGDRRAVS